MALEDLKILKESLIKQVSERIKSMTPQQWRDAYTKQNIAVGNYLGKKEEELRIFLSRQYDVFFG